MSRWTGKCDFCDHCEMLDNPKDVVKKATIYYGDVRVDIKSEKDLFPYYTHLIASMASSKESQTIHLSQKSFIDDEEASSISWRVKDLIQIARKAKKEKVELTWDYAKDKLYDFKSEPIPYKQIIDILNKNPDIVKFHLPKDRRDANHFLEEVIVPWYFPNVHLARYNREREEFVEEAKRRGFATYARNGKEYKRSDGEYHPIIWKMCNNIAEYYESLEEYKNA